MNRWIWALLAAPFGGIPITAQMTWAQVDEPILEVEGILEPGDSQLSDGSLYDGYLFEGQAGQAVSIQLESAAFDTYLWLLDPAGISLAENDDAGSTTNSRIVTVLPDSGTYRIRVNTHNSDSQGAYRLIVVPTTADDPALRQYEADRLRDYGNEALDRADYQKALDYYRRALAIHQDTNDRDGESFTLSKIGFTYLRLGNYGEALEYHQRALAISQDIASRRAIGRSLNGIGSTYYYLGEYDQALEYQQRALAILQPAIRQDVRARYLQGWALNDIGLIYGILGDYEQAFTDLQHSLAISQGMNNSRGESLALGNIGHIYHRLGDFYQALDYLQRSLVISQDIGDRWGEGITFSSIGLIYSRLGNYDQALDYSQRALATSQDIGNRQGEGNALHNIGIIYNALGDYSQALDYYQRALAIRRGIGDRLGEGVTLNNVGVIYAWLGNHNQALSYYQDFLAISQDINHRLGEGVALNNIGWIYHNRGDYGQALNYFQRALTIREDIGDRLGLLESLSGIGYVYNNLREYGQALDYSQRALAISQDIGARESEVWILNNIGSIYDNLGNYSEALDYYQHSLAISQDIGDRAVEAITLTNIARWFESQGQPTLAILYFKQAINTYEAIRTGTQTLDLELQQSYTATLADDYRALADLLLQQNRVLEAQRVLDLLKVQELDDVLRGVRGEESTISGIPLTPEEQALIAESRRIFQNAAAIAQEISSLRQIPVAERTTDQNARIFDLENQQSALVDTFLAFVASQEVQDLIARLEASGSQGDLALELASEQFINLRNNLAALGSDETGQAALLYPLILENRIELVLVTSSGPPTHYPIAVDKATLRDTVFEFREALRDKNSTPEPLAQQLYDWLIPPELAAVLEQQHIGTLLYAPDGILRYVPLAALHDGDQWLVQRYRINHITAASLTNLNLQDAKEPLVLAGAFSQGSHPSPAGNFSGLPYAGIEVDNLTQLFPNTLSLLDEQFSLAGTAPLINDHTIVHFATHAAFLVDNPLESFILFGNGDRLTLQMLNEWQAGRFSNVDLVVLSACETGVGGVRDADGQEILGFGYAMQAVGAKAVIASLWPVSDGGTQVLMTRFYEYLSQGLSKTEALQQAQLSLITGEGVTLTEVERFINERQSAEAVYRRLAHPYYWAPFILIGNGL